ncbi:MAG TPA: DUF4189 domain-containing protein [Caulobacteraceae bacterium]
MINLKTIHGSRRGLGWTGAALAALALATTLAPLGEAHAASAFAASIPDDIANKGVAFGEGHNYSTRADAEAHAMAECLKQANSEQGTVPLGPYCKVLGHFDSQCIAVSMDPKAGTPGFGWAKAETLTEAGNEAIANCRPTAGPGRADACVVSVSSCDTTNTPKP